MTFLETLLVLLAAAIVLLQISRRFGIPYPTMLAAAGVGLALIPGVPQVGLDPHTALALFVAPALVDAAYDFPISAIRRLWRPLLALAVIAVFLSAAAVAVIGVELAGLPIYAALALGAIVAPPDAAAATAVLRTINMPRDAIAVLKGESMLNDSSALLLYGAATFIHSAGGLDADTGVRLGLAVPGGIALGILLGKLAQHMMRYVSGTLGGNVLEFVTTISVWIIAERLGLSAVLCLVAFAMTIARTAALTIKPRVRLHSFAVWESAVFLLNVLAFLLTGLQARAIVTDMAPGRLREAVWFAAAVIACLVVVRMAWVLIYRALVMRIRVLRGSLAPPSLRAGVLVGWCGMRGLVTLAAAIALPASFPQRDLIVLTSLAVVLVTLVVQGLTLGPLIHWLGLDGDNGLDAEIERARGELAAAALAGLDGDGPAVAHWRYALETRAAGAEAWESKREVGRKALWRQRVHLEELRQRQAIDADAFMALQEELDFAYVALTIDVEEHLEES